MSKRLFRKKLVPVGVHQAPEGQVVVTPQRVKRWVDSFNRLKADGIRFPVPWGHQLKAIPHGDVEAAKFAKARWNAGYIEQLEQDPTDGGLVFAAEPPPGYQVDPTSGDLVNPTDGTRIGEVSAGIGDWRDGKGRQHEDLILHAALVPLPVWAGQDGFTQLGTEADASTLSGATFRHQLSTTTMPDPKKKDKAGESDIPEAIEATEGSAGDDLEPTVADLEAAGDPSAPPLDPELSPTPTPDNAAAVAPDALAMTAEQVKQAIALLGQMQFPLGPDTNPANFMDRFLTGMAILQKQGVTLSPKSPDPSTQAPGTLDTDTSGAAPESQNPGMGMMMSTATGKAIQLDSLPHKLATAAGDALRRQLKADWIALGLNRPEKFKQFCEDEANELSHFTLSLDPDSGAVTLPAAVARLERTKKVVEALGDRELVEALTASLSTAAGEVSPADGPDAKAAQEELDKRARDVFGDPKAKAARF